MAVNVEDRYPEPVDHRMRDAKGCLIMSCNFKILTHQNSENVHLKLMGDFDGSSACELLNVLKTYSNKANRVFIHTDGLKEVDLFGKLVFQNDFTAIAQQPAGFVFTGEKLAP
jgi:hypothetical protein